MKKFLVLLALLCMGTSVWADVQYLPSEVLVESMHQRRVEKVTAIGQKIIYDNKLKRVPLEVSRTPKVIGAHSRTQDKTVVISDGMLPYLDNDDELAAILAHEIAHSIEAYDGALKVIAMNANSKKYEYKADLTGIDYMVKAGYNPIAAIIAQNKLGGEPVWDWGFVGTHPKGSKRTLEMYKYIYVKYPKYLTSTMTKNLIYQNFLQSQSDEIGKFEQKQKRRQMKQEEI